MAALKIEHDMMVDAFDETLERYHTIAKSAVKTRRAAKKTVANGSTGRTEPSTPEKVEGKKASRKTEPEPFILAHDFERWARSYRQIDCTENMHYYGVRSMLRRWGLTPPQQVLDKLNDEPLGNQTYNERLAILNHYFNFLMKQRIWTDNPLDGVSKKKLKRVERPDRKPFTEEEIASILSAFKNDAQLFKTRHKLSTFYPFIYFIFKTGVRNAEAVGLRMEHIYVKNNLICIKESLARSGKGTNAASRVRKETKNGKVRYLPLTPDLRELFEPLQKVKKPGDLVFTTPRGYPMDDKMFQERIFKNVLKALNIPYRVLYACRHTFGSRCIEAGVTPVMTAFLMGNNPETALRNYVHQMSIPNVLPHIGPLLPSNPDGQKP